MNNLLQQIIAGLTVGLWKLFLFLLAVSLCALAIGYVLRSLPEH